MFQIVFFFFVSFVCAFSLSCSRQAGHRLCNYIDRIMVLINEYSQQDDDELREFCNQACEAFVQRCPEAITPHIKPVIFNIHAKQFVCDEFQE